MADIPKTMRSLVAPKPCKPDEYEVRNLPVPTISDPDEVLLRVHAAGINTGDPQVASGQLSIFHKPEYPLQIGVEGSGVVVAVGSAVKNLKVGDEVYGFYVDKPITKYPPPGFVSDYALARERFLLPKPAHVSFEEAASLTGFVVTALQTIRRGLELGGLDSLQGKTVFVPGALSGTGSVIIQVARNVFGAERIISTVSTAKLGLVEQYLPGMVDRVVDYTKGNVGQAVGRGIVDFAINTQRTSLDDTIAVVNPREGVLVSIVDGFSKDTIRGMIGPEKFNWLFALAVTVMNLYWRQWKLRGTSILYDGISGSLGITEDMEKAGEIIAQGKAKGVIRVVNLGDLDAVKKGCEEVRLSKGGVGKLVIKLV